MIPSLLYVLWLLVLMNLVLLLDLWDLLILVYHLDQDRHKALLNLSDLYDLDEKSRETEIISLLTVQESPC